MIDDLNDAVVDQDESVQATLAHAAMSLLVLEPELAQRVRSLLSQDARENPRLADDQDRVVRMCDRYVKAASQGDVQPASELMGM